MGEKIHLGLWISVGAFFIYHWGENTAKNKVRTLILMDFEDRRQTIIPSTLSEPTVIPRWLPLRPTSFSRSMRLRSDCDARQSFGERVETLARDVVIVAAHNWRVCRQMRRAASASRPVRRLIAAAFPP